MVVLDKFFGNNLDIKSVKYRKTIKKIFVIKNRTENFVFNSNDLYILKLRTENSTIINKIRKGIILRKIEGKNSKIINKINSDFSILVDIIHSEKVFEYETIGKAKNFYHFVKVTNKKETNSKIKIIILNEKKVVSITNIIIPKRAMNSFSNIEKIFINKENSILTSLPILVVKNNSSKAFHSSKTLKLNNDQIFYLKSKGIRDVEKLIIDSLIS